MSSSVTALVDLLPAPPLEPGIKYLHLITTGFTNPGPGQQRIRVEKLAADGSVSDYGVGKVIIVPFARPAINVASVFTGVPGNPNTIFQTIPLGGMPLNYDFLVWGHGGEPATGVSISNGRLVRELPGGNSRTVGHVSIEAPPDAVGSSLTSNVSVPINSPVLGRPTARLTVQFTPAAVAGIYRVHFRMNGGNEQTMQVEVLP